MPPIEADVDRLDVAADKPVRTDPEASGFNPLIAVAVLGVGGFLALGLLGLVAGVLLLIN